MFSQNSWCFHIIPIFLENGATTFFLAFIRHFFLPTTMMLFRRPKRLEILRGCGRQNLEDDLLRVLFWLFNHIPIWLPLWRDFCRCKAPNQLDFKYREYWGKPDPIERTLKAEYLLRLVLAGKFRETERTTQICLSHCWLADGREDQRLATICWKWPLANSRQINKDLSPTATRNWRLSITWSEPGSRFFPSLQTGAQPSQHLDFSLLRL